ncbi:MAG: hypothetical protein ACREUM_11585, partial [Nitrosospira sp.]
SVNAASKLSGCENLTGLAGFVMISKCHRIDALPGSCKNNAISVVRSIKYMKLSSMESFSWDYRRFRKDISRSPAWLVALIQ